MHSIHHSLEKVSCVPAILLSILLPAGATGLQAQPSFDCTKADGTVEEMICADPGLAALDLQLAEVWRHAMDLSRDNVDLPMIKTEQRGWIKGRNECWKSDDVRHCVEDSYNMRIGEIQARWRLLPARGPFFYACENNPANEVVATFFGTDPPIAVLERGDSSVVAFLRPTGSGARYEGQNVIFWNKGAEATVTWGWEAEPMQCRERQNGSE
jgi:uncharacterized protein